MGVHCTELGPLWIAIKPDPLLYYKMIILRYHEIFSGWQHQKPCQDTLVLSAWKKYHDIVILSFCNIVKGQAKRTCHLEIMNITFTYVLGYTFTFCSTLANVRTHQVLIWTIRNIISIMWQPNNKIWVSYHLDLLNGCFEVIWSRVFHPEQSLL